MNYCTPHISCRLGLQASFHALAASVDNGDLPDRPRNPRPDPHTLPHALTTYQTTIPILDPLPPLSIREHRSWARGFAGVGCNLICSPDQHAGSRVLHIPCIAYFEPGDEVLRRIGCRPVWAPRLDLSGQDQHPCGIHIPEPAQDPTLPADQSRDGDGIRRWSSHAAGEG